MVVVVVVVVVVAFFRSRGIVIIHVSHRFQSNPNAQHRQLQQSSSKRVGSTGLTDSVLLMYFIRRG